GSLGVVRPRRGSMPSVSCVSFPSLSVAQETWKPGRKRLSSRPVTLPPRGPWSLVCSSTVKVCSLPSSSLTVSVFFSLSTFRICPALLPLGSAALRMPFPFAFFVSCLVSLSFCLVSCALSVKAPTAKNTNADSTKRVSFIRHLPPKASTKDVRNAALPPHKKGKGVSRRFWTSIVEWPSVRGSSKKRSSCTELFCEQIRFVDYEMLAHDRRS